MNDPKTPFERQALRYMKVTQAKLQPPRELTFVDNMLRWSAPQNESGITAYRIRLDTDGGDPNYQVPHGQHSLQLFKGAKFYVTSYNEVMDRESSPAFLDASYGVDGNITLGSIDGTITFSSLTAAISNPDADGKRQWNLTATYSTDILGLSAVEVWIEDPTGNKASKLTTCKYVAPSPCTAVFQEAPPAVAKEIRVYLVPVAGNTVQQLVSVADASGDATLTVSANRTITINPAPNGNQGVEYASVVTGLTKTIPNPPYATNAAGQQVLRVDFSWTNPSDTRFGGVMLFMVRGGATLPISGLVSTGFHWETSNFPSSDEGVTVYALSCNKSNQPNTYFEGVTPKVVFNLPAPTTGGDGVERAPVVTSFSASVSSPSTADGTAPALVTCTFTPPAAAVWSSAVIRLSSDSGTTWGAPQASGSKSPLTFTMVPGIIAATFLVGAFSVDVNGKENSYRYGVTPTASIIVGNAAGQFDCAKFKASTYDSDIFVIRDGKMTVWAMNGSLLVAGTVSSAALVTTQINVGGGGNKPGKFAVYNASGSQIGFIGVEDGVSGAWFQALGVGGSNKSAPIITADSSGNVSIDGATLVLDSNNVRTTINNSSTKSFYRSVLSEDTAGTYQCSSVMRPAGFEIIDANHDVYLIQALGLPTGGGDRYGKISISRRTSAGATSVRCVLDANLGISDMAVEYRVNGTKVVGSQGAAVADPTVSIPTTGSTVADAVTGGLYNFLVELLSKHNDLRNRIEAHGLTAAH